MKKFRVLSLFAGIGGFDLGLERSGGFETVAFCEINEYCRAVLRKHWPDVPCYDDVRTLTAGRLNADGIVPDVICGGFPCQDISIAWNGPGLAGDRSGLWAEYLRLICEVRPRFVIVENVSALLYRGLDQVLGQLAEIGFDAEWHCIPASAVGAPHRRDRVWIVAYPNSLRKLQPQGRVQDFGRRLGNGGESMAHTDSERRNKMEQPESGRQARQGAISAALYASITARRGWWETEPDVGRVADGVPNRVDRLRALGNAVIPQIPEVIGEAIMRAERSIAA